MQQFVIYCCGCILGEGVLKREGSNIDCYAFERVGGGGTYLIREDLHYY